jgi:hypothetical protein
MMVKAALKDAKLHVGNTMMAEIGSPDRRGVPDHRGMPSSRTRPRTLPPARKLSQQHCAECHVVAPGGKRGWTDAPAFDAITNRRGTTAQTLSTFIQHEHMHMVNTGHPPTEANEIAAYFLSLRKSWPPPAGTESSATTSWSTPPHRRA